MFFKNRINQAGIFMRVVITIFAFVTTSGLVQAEPFGLIEAEPLSLIEAEPLEVTFGGSGKDGVRKMVRSQNGGFLLSGWQDQKGLHDTGTGSVISVTDSGVKRWALTLETNGHNQASSILERSDGSIVAVLEEYASEEDPGQVVLFELTESGEIIASHSVGGIGSDVADSIKQTADGGYVIAGESSVSADKSMNGWVAKLSPGFELQWQWQQGTEGRDRLNDVYVLADGSIVAAGNTNKFNADNKAEADAWVVKLDKRGRELWLVRADLKGASSIRDLLPTEDGGFMFVGYSKQPGQRALDAWMGKIDSSGTFLWEQSLSMEGSDYLHSISRTAEGGYLAAGGVFGPESGTSDAIMVELSEDGSINKQHRIERNGSEAIRAIQALGEGRYIATGAITQPEKKDEQMWFLSSRL